MENKHHRLSDDSGVIRNIYILFSRCKAYFYCKNCSLVKSNSFLYNTQHRPYSTVAEFMLLFLLFLAERKVNRIIMPTFLKHTIMVFYDGKFNADGR